MEEMDSVTKYLQTRSQPLETARLALYMLLKQISDGVNTEGKLFHRFTFEPRRILFDHPNSIYSRLYPSKHFECGLVKIQRGKEEEMT